MYLGNVISCCTCWATSISKRAPNIIMPVFTLLAVHDSRILMGTDLDYYKDPVEAHFGWAASHAAIGCLLSRVLWQFSVPRYGDLACLLAYHFGYALFPIFRNDVKTQMGNKT